MHSSSVNNDAKIQGKRPLFNLRKSAHLLMSNTPGCGSEPVYGSGAVPARYGRQMEPRALYYLLCNGNTEDSETAINLAESEQRAGEKGQQLLTFQNEGRFTVKPKSNAFDLER